MKLRSVTYALFIAGLAAFSTSSLAAQSLRFGYETSQTDSQHIAAKKFNDLLQERTKGELKLKLFPDNQQKIIDGMKEAGVEVITDLDRKAFSDALGTQVRDMFVKDVPHGADLLKAVDEVQ